VALNDIVLMSYPRSGVNWLSYSIDALWNIETQGLFSDYTTPRFFKNREPRKDKVLKRCHAHRSFEIPEIESSNKMICLVRDPFESITSHLLKSGLRPNPDLLKGHLRGCLSYEGHTDWLYVLNIYKNFSNKKMLIYYEDLLTDPKTTLLDVASFIEEDDSDICAFIEDIELHKRNSISNYSSLGKAETALNKDTDFYKRIFSEDTKIEVKEMLMSSGIDRYTK
jgi:hypothetical protein